MVGNSILEVSNLSKSYDGKVKALADCNFNMESGNISAIVGESGSGKSTLLRLIAGLERPDSGEIKVNQSVVSDNNKIVKPQMRNIGLVFQDFALFPHLTVEENIAYGVKENKTEIVNSLLQLVKMEGYNTSYPSQLSGGQEQRIALARTLAIKPKLLLLDEPFSSLDVGLKSELRKEIRTIVKKIQTSMIFITHDISDAIDIADEIIFMKKGVIVHTSRVSDLSKSINNKDITAMMSELKANMEGVMNLFKNS
jgi:iron(III) transport system ATP-binding protein